MKKLVCSVLFLIPLLFVCGGKVAAESADVYLAVPLVFDRTAGNDMNVTAIGGGVKLGTAEYDDSFGAALGVTVYSPLALSWTNDAGLSTTSVSDAYSTPVGLDFFLGVDMNLLKILRIPPVLGFITFPMNFGFHSKVDFYEVGPQINFGVAGSVGAQLNLFGFGIFARAQISYDFYGTQHVNAAGGWQGGRVNQWGIQPQIGISISD